MIDIDIDIGILVGCIIIFGLVFSIISLFVLIRRELTINKNK